MSAPAKVQSSRGPAESVGAAAKPSVILVTFGSGMPEASVLVYGLI